MNSEKKKKKKKEKRKKKIGIKNITYSFFDEMINIRKS